MNVDRALRHLLDLLDGENIEAYGQAKNQGTDATAVLIHVAGPTERMEDLLNQFASGVVDLDDGGEEG